MLEQLRTKINHNEIINEKLFVNCDLDELLDMRDDDEFDSEWMRIYNVLSSTSITENQKKEIDFIREESFIMAYNLSGSSDIASCISDDIELICKAYILNFSDNWLNSLILSYANRMFPCGKLIATNKTLEECITCLLK